MKLGYINKICLLLSVLFYITNCITYDNERICDRGKTTYLYFLASTEKDYKNGKITASEYNEALTAGIMGMLLACQPYDKKQQN